MCTKKIMIKTKRADPFSPSTLVTISLIAEKLPTYDFESSRLLVCLY